MKLSRLWVFALCAVGALTFTSAYARAPVQIGAILPLSGSTASVGASAKAAIEVAEDIINNPHPELGDLLLAKTAGLPNLGGAKIHVIFSDSQASPSVGQTQALRLITQKHVTALLGAYQSGVTFTASAVAERRGVPFITGASTAPNLNERGFKWYFRVTPVAPTFAAIYVKFLQQQKVDGHPVHTVAMVYVNNDYGKASADAFKAAVKKAGMKLVEFAAFNGNSTDVSSEILRLKKLNPDAVVLASYTPGAILLVKTMKALDYRPPIVIGDDAGFSDVAFRQSVGNIAQGLINRAVWNIGKPGSQSYRINQMYKKITGREMDSTTGRIMQAFFVLADAINRAGSTNKGKILKALQTTDIPPSKLLVQYKGVKFAKNGQNILGSAILEQLEQGKYEKVWPTGGDSVPLHLPYKGW